MDPSFPRSSKMQPSLAAPRVRWDDEKWGFWLNPVQLYFMLSRLGHAGHLQASTSDQLGERVTRLLHAYGNGWIVLELFSGLWLLPFGYLVFKCGFLPRTLGVLLIIGGISYVVDFIVCVLFPAYTTLPAAGFTTAPAAVAEIVMCLWLLIVGAHASRDTRPWRQHVSRL